MTKFSLALGAFAFCAAPALAQNEQLHFLSRYTTGLGTANAEIAAFDASSNRMFCVNGGNSSVDIVDLSNAASPALVTRLSIAQLFGDAEASAAPNSVAASNGLIAVAIERKEPSGRHKPGRIAFFNPAGALIDVATTGYLPDMVTFSPDGRFALTANEGEPTGDYSFDAEGSVSIVDCTKVRLALANPSQAASYALTAADVKLATFGRFNSMVTSLRAAGVRIYGPNATVAQDLEPEYITVPQGSIYAYVTLQENNAVAMVNMLTGVVARIMPLGYKDWSLSAFDASDRDFAIKIQSWPVYGMYQPDAIVSFRIGTSTYFLTANEGDARDYSAFKEEKRVKDLTLDPTAFPNAATLRLDQNLGRLTVTDKLGNPDNDGDFDQLYTLGGRSFTIYRAGNSGTLTRIYDSGDQLEQITAQLVPSRFNGDPVFDTRSDNKGPEPEGAAVGVVNGRTYAFVCLERTNGVMMFDVSNPNTPVFRSYLNTSTVSGSSQSGDVSPEGLVFVPAAQSPSGNALVLSSNELSGTVAIYEVR